VPDDLAVDHLRPVQLSLKVAPTSSHPALAPRRPIIPVIPFRPVVTTSPPRVGPGSAPRSVTMGGSTVDAATAAACRHLGVPLSTVRVEVLDYGRPKRPFQAAELARVRVTER
jgi:hypothetical protein